MRLVDVMIIIAWNSRPWDRCELNGILTTQAVKKTSCGQNRLQMIGIWRKKLLFSTVLIVVDQVMLYPTRWETKAADIGIDMPVKKILKNAR
jgi:hypothetical protein